MQLERDWVTATLKRDKVWLERFFADEFISTHPTSGTIKNKAREIADTVDPAQTPESSTLGEMKAIVAGKTAIVTGAAYEIGGAQHLTDRKRGYLFTDTFIRRGGRWQLLASHSSRLPTSEISAEERREIERELLKMENEWAQVDVTNDKSVFQRILAPDFVSTSRSGKFLENRQEYVADWEYEKIKSAANSDMRVHIYSDSTAIVTGIDTTKGADKAGKEWMHQDRFTDTYVKRKGVWQCVAAQVTRIK